MRVRRNSGFALLAALWLLVAISAVTLEMGLEGRERRAAVANRVETARTGLVAEAGLRDALAKLSRLTAHSDMPAAPGSVDPWTEPHRLVPRAGRLRGGGRYQIAARDVGGLLNLNVASEIELRRFLSALAIDDGTADRIAQSIMDWKDPDDCRRARGAESEQYLEADAPVLPANGPFRRVEELEDLLGMTRDIYRRIAPLVTVTGTGRVNLASAPVPVLSALPGMEPAVVRAVLERRRRGPIGSIAQLSEDLPPGQRDLFEVRLPELLSRTTVETQEVELTSEGWYEGETPRSRLTALAVRSGSAVFLFRTGSR